MNYNWRIVKLGLNDQLNQDGVLLENAIVQVQWKLTAEDTDGTKASYLASTTLDATNISAEDFVAVNSVSSEQVIGWVQSNLSSTEMDRINKQLDVKVERNRVRKIKPNW